MIWQMWFLVAGAALILGYEIWSALNRQMTISQLVWAVSHRPAVPFLIGLGGGLLGGHLFL